MSPNTRLQPGDTMRNWEVGGKLRAGANDHYILPSPSTFRTVVRGQEAAGM